MPVDQWMYDLANRVTVIVMLIYFVTAISKGWWVSGREYDALAARLKKVEETSEAQGTALREAVHALHQVVSALQARTPQAT